MEKQFPSLCNLYSFYEEILEKFLEETDLDGNFYHTIFDKSQSQHRKIRVSKSSKKSLLQSSCSNFAIKRHSSVISSKKKLLYPKNLSSLVDGLHKLLRTFHETSKCLQIPLPKLKNGIASTKSEDNLLLVTIMISLNIQLDKFGYRSDLETTNLVFFPSKKFLQKMSNLTIAKFTISTKTYFTLQTSVKYLKAITMCSSFTPDCGYDNSTVFLIGDVNCPNTKCLGKLCLHKMTFQTLGRSNYEGLQWALVFQVSKNSFEDQKNSFLVVWPRDLQFWRASEIDSRGCWRCELSWQVIFQEREMRISWRLCNNS